MIIEPSNYTYETMPDYTDAVDGAVEIPVTGEEIEIRYAHEVVYDEAHNLHLEIFTPFQMAHPERTWPCITFIQGSAWMKQYVYQKVGMIARLAQRGYVVASWNTVTAASRISRHRSSTQKMRYVFCVRMRRNTS